jgi:hypothetical protein
MAKPLRTEAIQAFLSRKTHKDLSELYGHNMECQVNVLPLDGERAEREYMGNKYYVWTDGINTWKAFRIPRNASTEPEYTDVPMSYDLETYAEAIGLTGWDWENKVSCWVAFDFDAIIGHSDAHSNKLTEDELLEIQHAVEDIPWVSIRKSTGGRGLHLYVFLNNIPTRNHNEHAALARAILGKMAFLTGKNLEAKVDVCGGNMWIWHRKMTIENDGLRLVQDGTVMPASEVPQNWRDHISVVSRKRNHATPSEIEESSDSLSFFEQLARGHQHIQLDDKHRELIEFVKNVGGYAEWNTDRHMLVAHTYDLQQAHDALSFRGYFKTLSTGRDRGHDWNCFCFPMVNGEWSVRRFTRGIQEADSWSTDASGWTYCYLNRDMTLAEAARACGGVETNKLGVFEFKEAETASRAAQLIGVIMKYHPGYSTRKTRLSIEKDGRLLVDMDGDTGDLGDQMQGWHSTGKKWTKRYQFQEIREPEIISPVLDDIIRHVVTPNNEGSIWVANTSCGWVNEPKTDIRDFLNFKGVSNKESASIIGGSINMNWRLVNLPFDAEFPGDRRWNRYGAKLAFDPSDKDELYHPTWDLVLDHCGSGLDEAIKNDSWCRDNGVTTGSQYLLLWTAGLFQRPFSQIPYLFLYGDQNSGKSTFHEALSLLMTKGYQMADQALISQSHFNGELQGAVLCVVEEVNLQQNKQAYDRIKNWVTAKTIQIHTKRETPYDIPNTTHWIQCANDPKYCPVNMGDTRIVMINVPELQHEIPKDTLLKNLKKEAPDFLAHVMRKEIPPSGSRLLVPVVDTYEKTLAQQRSQTPVEKYICEKCVVSDGHAINFDEFYGHIRGWFEEEGFDVLSKQNVEVMLPSKLPKGRLQAGLIQGDTRIYLGNVRWADEESEPIIKGKFRYYEGWIKQDAPADWKKELGLV